MQNIAVILIVSLAFLYLGWKFYKKFYKKEEGCDKCDMNKK